MLSDQYMMEDYSRVMSPELKCSSLYMLPDEQGLKTGKKEHLKPEPHRSPIGCSERRRKMQVDTLTVHSPAKTSKCSYGFAKQVLIGT